MYFGKKFDCFFAKFMFYIFKIFGLATISYDHFCISEKKSSILIFKTSWIGIIYNVALICFFVPIKISYVLFLYRNEIYRYSRQEIRIFVAGAILIAFSAIFTQAVFIFQQSKMTSISVDREQNLQIERAPDDGTSS